jgi:cytochrome c oxidase subunit 1
MTGSAVLEAPAERAAAPGGAAAWLTTTDHKRIALLTIGTAVVLLFAMGALALTMRAQLALPGMGFLSSQTYDELFTVHGSGMIFLVVTPLAIGFGVYLVPLQVGAPAIAAPRATFLGYAAYVAGAVALLSGFATTTGAASNAWTAYTPLSSSRFSPGPGTDLWIVGTFLAGSGMLLMAATTLWTALRLRAPGMSLMRMPVFSWSMVATNLMVVAAFPALLAAMVMLMVARHDPGVFSSNTWNVAYQEVFWFYGHPVVYVMFFPFVGAVAEVAACFGGRRFVGYRATVLSLLAFATLSMGVWGHHMFVTGQVVDDFYSLVSIFLLVPAGLEYFGIISTLVGARIHFRTAMLFAIAFLPMFLVGGLTGIMLGTPVVDYHVEGSYFVVAHFHYTLIGGSLSGFFAGFYYWFPKATGRMLDERLGKLNFWLFVVGTNVTFLPMFVVGFLGMPRRVSTYSAGAGWTALNLTISIGAGVIGLSMAVFAWNLLRSLRRGKVAGDDPWGAFTLEWATTSPPPLLNFARPLPPVRSYAPLLDLREAASP